MTVRGSVTERSMFAFWMSGIEDQPERSGEICVALTENHTHGVEWVVPVTGSGSRAYGFAK